MKIGFIATSGVGKTTVATLLFTAVQLYRGGGDTWKDRIFIPAGETHETVEDNSGKLDFDFLADVNTLNVLEELNVELESGSFPPPTQMGSLVEISAQFIYQKKLKDKIFNRDQYSQLTVYDIAGGHITEINDLIKVASADTNPNTLTEKLEANKVLASLLNSDVFVLLLDSSNCFYEQQEDFEKKRDIMRELRSNDFAVAKVLTMVQAYKMRMKQDVKGLAFLFTKHDEIMNSSPPLLLEKDYENLLNNYFNVTNTQFLGMKRKYNISNIGFFKSGIKIHDDLIDDKKVPDMPLKFYIGEYLRLLRWLSNLS